MFNKLPQPWRTIALVALVIFGIYLLYTSAIGLWTMKQVGPIP